MKAIRRRILVFTTFLFLTMLLGACSQQVAPTAPALGLAQAGSGLLQGNIVGVPAEVWQQVQVDLNGPDLVGKDGPLTKVGSDLALLYRQQQALSTQGVVALATVIPYLRVADGSVVIDAVASGDARALLADLEALGLEGGAVFGRYVSGRLPIGAIADAAALSSLRLARPAAATTNVGLTTSQGDAAMKADDARTLFGVDGTGITIGTLSDSYDCLGGAATDVANNDLPSGVNVLQDEVGCNSGSDEGRAMMQLIHDVAPGSSQAFHTAFGGMADFAQGILDLQAAGADVIVDDVIYFAESMFQDGIIAQAVDDVVALGAAYFSSAGNYARQSYESAFRPSSVTSLGTLSGYVFHDFDPGAGEDVCQAITFPGNSSIIFAFQWDEPFFSVSGAPGSANDMDIFLFPNADCTGSPVSFGNSDNLGGDPVEIIGVTNNGASPAPAAIAIGKFSASGGPNPNLMKYVLFGGNSLTFDEFGTLSATSFGHANAEGAEAVGAAFYQDTPEFGTNPPLLESFSSAGGVPILFATTGTRLATPIVRQKPEITAPDGTNTTFFGSDIEPDGFPNFFGTSAAAPHAAAVAALLLGVSPSLMPAQTYAILESTAIDMMGAGFDFDTGFGLIQADAAIQAISLPNLAFDTLPYITPANPTVSDEIQVCYTVINNGNAPVPGPLRLSTAFLDGTSVSSWIWQGLQPGEITPVELCHTLYQAGTAVAGPHTAEVRLDPEGVVAESNENDNIVTVPFTVSGSPPASPPNDDFANAIVISGPSGTTTGTNVNATKEAGEPNHGNNPGGASVWWNWTAPGNGNVTIDTFGSDYDTTLGAYTGSSVSTLTSLAQNDDANGTLQSSVTFAVQGGTTYSIAVDGYSGAQGNITLNWNFTPPANTPPFVTTPIPDQTATVGDPNIVIDLTQHFDDAEDGPAGLTYTVTGGSPCVTPSVSGTNLTLAIGSAGSCDVTIQATDSGNLSVNDTFTVTVNAPPGTYRIIPFSSDCSGTAIGGQCTVAVHLEGSQAGDVWSALQFDISGPEFTPTSASSAGLTNGCLADLGTSTVGIICSNSFSGNGLVAEITLQRNADGAGGTFVETSNAFLVDPNGTEVPAAGGRLDIPDFVCAIESFANFPLGDFNASGNINVTDALLVLQTATGSRPNPTPFEAYHSDLNSSGNINVTDALLDLQKAVDPSRPPVIQAWPPNLSLSVGQIDCVLIGNSGWGGLEPITVTAPPGVSVTDHTPAGAVGKVYWVSVQSGGTSGAIEFRAEPAGEAPTQDTINLAVP